MSPSEPANTGPATTGGHSMHNARHWVASGLLAIAVAHTLPKASARDEVSAPVMIDLPAQPLTKTLLAIGTLTGRQIIFPGDAMAGLSAPGIEGRLTAPQALARALMGTGFKVEMGSDAIYIRLPSGAAGGQGAEQRGEAIVVTGSRIRGVASASQVYSYETAQARDQGITDMRGLAAAIPQNFTGGQSPGVGNGAEASGSRNTDSSTALNLRGLGPGSTLTLLNGHRLAYNLSNQSVDFSSIPFAAVERVEIMPDGASALYGSDAIGGVANIVLKKDLRGVTANAVLGAATDGGYSTQNYNVAAGTRWRSGGVLLTGNYDRNTEILAGDRSFASGVNEHLTLYPKIESYAVVGSGHQDVGENLVLALDALYAHRDAVRASPYTNNAPVEVSGIVFSTSSWNLSVAPSATLRMSDWQFSLVGIYGRSHLRSRSHIFPSYFSSAVLENETIGSEIAGDGPLVAIPGGDIRLAFGGGYRRDAFISRAASNPIDAHQENIFGYAELSIPLSSPDQEIPGFYRTSLSAAVRYEDYPGIGRLATPKLGFVSSPNADVDFKLSWGRSFKSPTLYQRLNPVTVYLFPGNLYGERPGAPAGQTILAVYGGNSELKPEKADSLSASLVFHPSRIPGLDLSLSYFRVNYRNRIVDPISSLNRVLIDPVFGNLVQFSPTPQDIAATIAMAPLGLENQTGSGAPFDPASVYATIDGRSQNVAKDQISGVDLSLSYRFDAGSLGTLSLFSNATYLRSSRILIAGMPKIDLAGTIFNPPHFKLRGGVGWSRDSLLVNAVINYIGGVNDNRRVDTVELKGMASVDLSVKYHVDVAGGVDVQVSALNILNAKPDIIRNSGNYMPVDSTNYSTIGRYMSLSLTKSF